MKNPSLIKGMAILSIMVLPIINIASQGHQSAFAKADPSQGTVAVYALNVREAADISSKITGLVHEGDTFDILNTRNNWDEIKLSNNRTGWVYNAFLAPTENIKATVEAIVLRVRKNPSFFSKVIGKLKFGTNIMVQAEKDGWAKIVSSSGVEGWVYEYYISKDAATKPQPDMAPASKTPEKKSLNQSSDSARVSAAHTTSPSIINSQKSLNGKTIVLDPGHGGMDVGTTSFDGTYEKTLTLATAKAVEQKLENAGANVIMTRSSDRYIPLVQRADLSNQNHADAFISFHYNWSNDPSVNGLTDFYYHKSRDGSLAEDILNEVVKTTKLTNLGTKFDDLSVLRNNIQPSTLIELGFVSNKQEASIVESSAYRNNVAQGVYQGLLDYFQTKTK